MRLHSQSIANQPPPALRVHPALAERPGPPHQNVPAQDSDPEMVAPAPRETVTPPHNPWLHVSQDTLQQAAVAVDTSSVAEPRWRRLLRLGPTRDAVEMAEDEAAMRTELPAPVTIVIAQPKGGAGKTPTTIGLSSAIGSARGGDVLAVDNNELRGTLIMRSEAQHTRTMGNLTSKLDWYLDDPTVNSLAVHWCTNWQTAGFKVLAADPSAEGITGAQFAGMHEVLTRYFPILIVDTGNSESAPNWQTALSLADVIVVPLRMRRDHLIPASQMLARLSERGVDIARKVVTVVSNGNITVRPDAAEFTEQWFSMFPRIDVPYDPVIESSGPMTWATLSPATRRAYRQLGATVIPMAVASKNPSQYPNPYPEGQPR